MALLEIKNLSKSYGNLNKKGLGVFSKNTPKPYDYAIKDIGFKVEEGEFIAIVGPSGAGKSTLIRLINRLVPLDKNGEGEILFDNEEIHCASNRSLKRIRSKIGFIFQHHNLIEQTSIYNNVLHGRLGETSFLKSFLGLYTKKDKEKVEELLKTVGLLEFKNKKVRNLSGGQMQRVGICRALMQNPKLLLADEPIASLDPISSKIVMETIKSFELTTIVNLHQVEFAKEYATRIIGMKKGQIIFDGKPSEFSETIIKDIYE